MVFWMLWWDREKDRWRRKLCCRDLFLIFFRISKDSWRIWLVVSRKICWYSFSGRTFWVARVLFWGVCDVWTEQRSCWWQFREVDWDCFWWGVWRRKVGLEHLLFMNPIVFRGDRCWSSRCCWRFGTKTQGWFRWFCWILIAVNRSVSWLYWWQAPQGLYSKAVQVALFV